MKRGESCAKTKTEMALVTAVAGPLAWPCPRGPSAAARGRPGPAGGRKRVAGSSGLEEGGLQLPWRWAC